MGFLQDKRFYLSSPIEHAPNETNWVKDISKVLKNEFKIEVFNPIEDKKQQWAPQLKKYKEERNFKGVRKIAKKFVKKDLGLVCRSDVLVAFLPYKICTTGVYHEIIQANLEKKPTLLVSDSGIQNIPAWFFGFIPLRYMFDDVDCLYKYLRKVDSGKCKKDSRWWFTYNMI